MAYLQVLFIFVLLPIILTCSAFAENLSARHFPLFTYLTGKDQATMVAYSPLGFDPRIPYAYETHPISALRTDLKALRPGFNGLILYGYHHILTTQILNVAKEMGYRAVLLGIWQPKHIEEIDGVAQLINQFKNDLALGIIIGNEGITFNRYTTNDLTLAARRLKSQIPSNIALTTSEPLRGYQLDFIRNFGDFVAPNIHPVWDRPELNAASAATWARHEAIQLAQKIGKPLLLKETGFPHHGHPNYTWHSQYNFWASYLESDITTYLNDSPQIWVSFSAGFEAFDLHWKAEFSDLPMEASWGLLSAKRKPYPAFTIWKNLAMSTQP